MKKHKLLLIIIVVMACALAFLTGCGMNDSVVPEDYQQAGYRRVLFYYNGGQESGSQNIEYFVKVAKGDDPLVVTGGRLPAPVNQGEIKNPIQQGYQFYAWFQINMDLLRERTEDITDTDGNRVLDTRGNPATRKIYYIEGHDFQNKDKNEEPLTYNDWRAQEEAGDNFEGERIFIKEWDFDFDLVTEDICLMAVWSPIRMFVVVPPSNKNDNFDAEDYSKLPLHPLDASGGVSLNKSNFWPKKTGSQIKGFYEDSRLTIKIDPNKKYYPKEEFLDDEKTEYKVTPIYIDWLPSRYTIIESASKLTNISGTGYYYINADLDFGGKSLSMGNFSGEILGNGYSWKNINFIINQPRPTNPLDTLDYCFMFGNLTNAKISNIKFENITFTFERINPLTPNLPEGIWTWPIRIKMFAKSIDETSSINNVDFINATYNVKDYTTTTLSARVQDKYYENGYRVLLGTTGERLEYIPGVGYEPEGTIKTDKLGGTYPLKYARDYKGELVYDTENVYDAGMMLYGYDLYDIPDAAANIDWRQFDNNFGLNPTNAASSNITDCDLDVALEKNELDWLVEYEGGRRPPSLQSVTQDKITYEFDDWYTTDFERYNFDYYTQPVTLIALFKVKVSA